MSHDHMNAHVHGDGSIRYHSHGMPPDEPDPMSYIEAHECTVPFCVAVLDSVIELEEHRHAAHPELYEEE